MIRRLVVAGGCAVVASVMLAGSLAAQAGVLSGAIYDQTNKIGLGGVDVRVKGTDLVATTGKDGRFTIAGVPAGTREIEAVRAGFRTFRLPLVRIVADDTAHVYLALSAMPEERIRNDSEELRITDGVVVGDRILLKGSTLTSIGEISQNAPLYLVDGVMLAPGTAITKLDPKSIESVEVLKGAAAEQLYGTRGANGVIKITTRRPPD